MLYLWHFTLHFLVHFFSNLLLFSSIFSVLLLCLELIEPHFLPFQDGEDLGEEFADAVEMLLRMPGISWRNYQRVIARVDSIAELVDCSLDRLTEILENR